MVNPPSIGRFFDGTPPLGSSLIVVLSLAQPQHLTLPFLAVVGRDAHAYRVWDKLVLERDYAFRVHGSRRPRQTAELTTCSTWGDVNRPTPFNEWPRPGILNSVGRTAPAR